MITILVGMLLFLVALVIGVSLGRAAAVPFPLPHCAPHLITLPCQRCLAGEPEEAEEPYDAAAWDRDITAMLKEWRMYNAEWRMKDSEYTL